MQHGKSLRHLYVSRYVSFAHSVLVPVIGDAHGCRPGDGFCLQNVHAPTKDADNDIVILAEAGIQR